MSLSGNRVALWGGGGHATVVHDIITARGGKLRLIIDRVPENVRPVLTCIKDVRLTSEVEFLDGIATKGCLPVDIDAVALGVGQNQLRHGHWQALHTLACPPLIHPSACVSRSAVIGAGTVVFPGAIVNAGAIVGNAVVINSGAVVEHDCLIGDGAHVAPNATVCGAAKIGADVLVGAGATVLPGIELTDGGVVGAGSVVTRNVLTSGVVVGIPAKRQHET